MLVRSVSCTSPPRLGMPSRAIVFAGPALMVVTVGLGIALSISAFWTRTMRLCGESKGDIASATVKKYAYEAYPSWTLMNPGRTCPSTLLELNEHMNNRNDLDPWGSHYRMYCEHDERGHPMIIVHSFGEDALAYSADDIWSR